MNRLSTKRREQVISALLEGCSIRSVERMTGVHRDTITRLLVNVGCACHDMMNESLRCLQLSHIQIDKIWAYVGKKQRHVSPTDDSTQVGDFWTYVALDTDTKLVPSYLVGKRSRENTHAFVEDLASRLDCRVQLSSDMMEAYVFAVEDAFGFDVDYGRIVKQYEAEAVGPGRYSPPKVVSTLKDVVLGNPTSPCTSHVERQNLTMRMSMRRFTRLTNAFSRRVENLRAAVALHFAYYNFARIHTTLRMSPAMASGVDSRLWDVRDLVNLAD